MNRGIITSNEDLTKLVKDGHFFNFCCAFALNKGHENAIREKKEVKFTVGNYNVEFDHKQTCFILQHKEYFARIIHAYFQQSVFIGDDEDEVISELLNELNTELLTTPTKE